MWVDPRSFIMEPENVPFGKGECFLGNHHLQLPDSISEDWNGKQIGMNNGFPWVPTSEMIPK